MNTCHAAECNFVCFIFDMLILRFNSGGAHIYHQVEQEVEVIHVVVGNLAENSILAPKKKVYSCKLRS